MKQKTKAVIAREVRILAFLEEVKDECARGNSVRLGVIGNKHGVSGGTYRAIRDTYLKPSTGLKKYTWNATKEINAIAQDLASAKKSSKIIKKGKNNIHSRVVLTTPNLSTKKEVKAAIQTEMQFKGPGISKLHNKIAQKCKVTVIVKEVRGGSTRAVEYTVDPTKYMFEDVDKSVQGFRNELTK
tara:strand:+ start:266 stop:820 length:555 start_codon:yes stop_codon:yes gene_type:complete